MSHNTIMPDEDEFYIVGMLHEARMLECYGKRFFPPYRERWSAAFKEYRGRKQAGQAYIDMAVAQAKKLTSYMTGDEVKRLAASIRLLTTGE